MFNTKSNFLWLYCMMHWTVLCTILFNTSKYVVINIVEKMQYNIDTILPNVLVLHLHQALRPENYAISIV